MHRKLNYFLLIMVVMLLSNHFATSQPALKQFAQQRMLQWQTKKAHAESLAVAQRMPIRKELRNGGVMELQSIENGIPIYFQTDNLNSAKTISTTKVWPTGGNGFSLSGDSVILGEWDGGKPRSTHREYNGRVTTISGQNNGHSTHVAGTMIASGVNSNAKGMSYKASIRAYSWDSDEANMALEAMNGLRASNHSYGLITGWTYDYFSDSRWAWFGDTTISNTEDYRFGFYNAGAKAMDDIATSAPYYLIMRSAGNDRNEGPGGTTQHWVRINGTWVLRTVTRSNDGRSGYDCINGAALGKNVFTVGAVSAIPAGYSNPSNVVMSSFSSWGPTDDGRIKPDIVADGVSLLSSYYDASIAQYKNDTSYAYLSGTSMATPSVTGAVGLLLEYQRKIHGSTALRSSTLKALIINTADEAGSNPGPDYIFGWGLMNTYKAIKLMQKDSIEGTPSYIRELLLTQGDTVTFDVGCNGSDSIKATICWTDPSGTPVAAALNPTNKMLVNDLDLRIIRKYDQTTYQPWILNPSSPTSAATTGDNSIDNVEQVLVTSTQRTVYTVQITHKGTLSGGQQYVSVAIQGIKPTLGPVYSAPSSASHSLNPEASILDSFKIINRGDSPLNLTTLIPDSIQKWCANVDGTLSIPSLDSAYLHYTINAESLGTWETHNGFISVLHNDSTQTPSHYNLTVNTLGPTIDLSKSQFVTAVDKDQTLYDTLFIRNLGSYPLHFSLHDSEVTVPPWPWNLDVVSGSVLPGDSARVVLTANTPSQPDGDYYSSLVIENNDTRSSVVLVHLALHVGTHRLLTLTTMDSWNLVALNGKCVESAKSILFPSAISEAFFYNGAGYETTSTLSPGQGYWLKFNGIQTSSFDGYVFNAETLDVHTGWNLIGSISNGIPVSAVIANPSDLLASYFFSYHQQYEIADSLKPGLGYWIKANQPGQLILSGTYPPLPKQTAIDWAKNFNAITIGDDLGHSQTLYFGQSDLDGLKPGLPPNGPSSCFDARFNTGTFIEQFNTASAQREMPIQIQAGGAPVHIQWDLLSTEKNNYSLVDEDGQMHAMIQHGKFSLRSKSPDAITIKLIAGGPTIPSTYALRQNYPNPFNPVTMIAFDLPNDARISLRIYNILGNEVQTLINNQNFTAGSHEISYSPQELPSGVYIYRLDVDGKTFSRKMLLMK
jgi:hypothetical protein